MGVIPAQHPSGESLKTMLMTPNNEVERGGIACCGSLHQPIVAFVVSDHLRFSARLTPCGDGFFTESDRIDAKTQNKRADRNSPIGSIGLKLLLGVLGPEVVAVVEDGEAAKIAVPVGLRKSAVGKSPTDFNRDRLVDVAGR